MKQLEQQILEFVSQPDYKPRKPSSIAKKLNVGKKRLPEFEEALDRLLEAGKLEEGASGRLKPRAGPGLVTGVVKRIASGAGYLIPHDPLPDGQDGDVFVTARDMGDAHTGDEVLVRLLKRRRKGQPCGRIEEVLQRSTSTFVGTYMEIGGQGFVRVDGNTFHEPVWVGDPGAKGAQADDKVVIEMLRFPTQWQEGEAVVTEVLGPRGRPGVDLQSIIHEFGLPGDFPEEVLDEARQQTKGFDEKRLGGRRDLTKETVVTIDPADARDFDDAISLTRAKNGHWHLGVHIADVAHFVQPGSSLDREAQERATSVYLPGRVIPMLPEVLSNGLASLQKGKVRYTKSVFIEFTTDGKPVRADFANSAVKVTRRFSYEEVLPILREPEKFKGRITEKVRMLLTRMYELAMILRGRRFQAGALELNIGEVEVELDKNGRVSGAHEVPHDESHQIIEEFMLAANTAVARELSNQGVPFLRRVHGDPDYDKLRAFAAFAEALGYPLQQFQSRHALQEVLDKVREQPEEHALNYALLRSLKPAEYTAEEMGHYALAVEDYCHFTSPIRRYPDLTVHRLVDQLLIREQKSPLPSEVETTKLGKHCSAQERRAERAERELTKIKLLSYMAERVGEELDAIITGVERFGFFCTGVEIPVDGLVHISSLNDDYYYYEATSFSLIGRSSKREFRLGDRVRVSVVHVDVDGRQLDFRVVSPGKKQRPSNKSRKRGQGKTKPKGGKAAPKQTRKQGKPKKSGSDGRKSSGGSRRKQQSRKKGKRKKGR